MTTRAVAGRRPAAPHRSTPCGTPVTSAAWVPVALERAELQFVARVVRDGGIGPWRQLAAARFRTAREAVTRSRLSRSETASLIVALADHEVRDGCWVRFEQDRHPGWVSLWRHLAAHALPPYRAEPLFLLAWSAWRSGDPILARTAVDAVRAEDPGHRAAAMLDRMLAAGLDAEDLRSLVDPEVSGQGAT